MKPAKPESAAPPTSRHVIGFAIAIAAVTVAALLPPAAGIKPEAQRLAGLFVAGMALWLSESLPMGVTALLVVAAQPVRAS